MPDVDEIEDDETQEDSSVIRNLRKQLKAKEAEAAEVGELRKKLALSEAKLELNPTQQKALLLTHEGDLTAEGLRQTATELGYLQAEDAKPEAQVPADEQAALQRVQEATAAAQPADGSPEKFEDRVSKAKTPEELRQIVEDAGISWNETDI